MLGVSTRSLKVRCASNVNNFSRSFFYWAQEKVYRIFNRVTPRPSVTSPPSHRTVTFDSAFRTHTRKKNCSRVGSIVRLMEEKTGKEQTFGLKQNQRALRLFCFFIWSECFFFEPKLNTHEEFLVRWECIWTIQGCSTLVSKHDSKIVFYVSNCELNCSCFMVGGQRGALKTWFYLSGDLVYSPATSPRVDLNIALIETLSGCLEGFRQASSSKPSFLFSWLTPKRPMSFLVMTLHDFWRRDFSCAFFIR